WACETESRVEQTRTAGRGFMGLALAYWGLSLFVIVVVTFCGRLAGRFDALVDPVNVGIGDLGVRPVGEVVKKGSAIGLGPDADFACVFESGIFPAEGFLAIEGDDEIVVFEINAKGVPLAGGDLGVDALLFGALTIDGVIDGDVVFIGVGAGDVIIVG